MKNYIQAGNTVSVPAPYAVASGAGVLVGQLFGIASSSAETGTDVQIHMTGVFDVAKAAGQSWAIGAAIYWDNTAKVATTTASGNTRIGAALLDATSGATIGRVRLSGTA